RCDRRLEAMAELGAIEEVKNLLARGLPPEMPVMKAVGVPELAAFLDKTLEYQAAIAAAQQATRNYAKRQYTWFRNQCRDWNFITSPDFDSEIETIASLLHVACLSLKV